MSFSDHMVMLASLERELYVTQARRVELERQIKKRNGKALSQWEEKSCPPKNCSQDNYNS